MNRTELRLKLALDLLLAGILTGPFLVSHLVYDHLLTHLYIDIIVMTVAVLELVFFVVLACFTHLTPTFFATQGFSRAFWAFTFRVNETVSALVLGLVLARSAVLVRTTECLTMRRHNVELLCIELVLSFHEEGSVFLQF